MYIIIAQQNTKWFTVACCLNTHMGFRDLVEQHRQLVICSLSRFHIYIPSLCSENNQEFSHYREPLLEVIDDIQD